VSRPLVAFALMAAASAVGIWIQPRSAGSSRGGATVPAPLAAPAIAPETADPTEITPPSHPHRRGAWRPAPAPAAPELGMASAAKVARDPVTGQLVAPDYASPVTIDEMQAAARREAEGLVTLHNPDGSETINHQGRFADQVVVRVGPDGRPVFVCTQGKAAAERVLRPTAPVHPGLEDR
jgi:hypothetical protein